MIFATQIIYPRFNKNGKNAKVFDSNFGFPAQKKVACPHKSVVKIAIDERTLSNQRF